MPKDDKTEKKNDESSLGVIAFTDCHTYWMGAFKLLI
jgi:hypothetical protein